MYKYNQLIGVKHIILSFLCKFLLQPQWSIKAERVAADSARKPGHPGTH